MEAEASFAGEMRFSPTQSQIGDRRRRPTIRFGPHVGSDSARVTACNRLVPIGVGTESWEHRATDPSCDPPRFQTSAPSFDSGIDLRMPRLKTPCLPDSQLTGPTPTRLGESVRATSADSGCRIACA